MSVEERLGLIGQILIEKSQTSTSEYTLTSEYTNTTGYRLRIQIFSRASFEIQDNDDSYDDLHWSLVNKKVIYNSADEEVFTEEETIGYAGSNNKQYDHHTWDTISDLDHILLEPDQKLVFTSTEVVISEGSSYTRYNRIMDMKFIICGALEPLQ